MNSQPKRQMGDVRPDGISRPSTQCSTVYDPTSPQTPSFLYSIAKEFIGDVYKVSSILLTSFVHPSRFSERESEVQSSKNTHRASRSDSKRARMSLSLTGPLTFRMIDRLDSSMNSTRTWVTPPRDPVRPRTWINQYWLLCTFCQIHERAGTAG